LSIRFPDIAGERGKNPASSGFCRQIYHRKLFLPGSYPFPAFWHRKSLLARKKQENFRYEYIAELSRRRNLTEYTQFL